MKIKTFLKQILILIIRNLPLEILILFIKYKLKIKKRIKSKKIKILILNQERFTQDIESLKLNRNIELINLDSKLQLFINNLWMYNTRDIFRKWRRKNQYFPYNKLYFSNENKTVINSKNNLCNYLMKLISKLKNEINFDCIMTCAVWYIQDKEWERASDKVNMPFVSIHKECMFDKDIIEQEINMKKKMLCKTYNSKVILYNEKAKEVLTKSEIVNLNNAYVLGSMRMDNLYRLRNSEEKKGSKIITIFSFTHRAGLINFTKQNTNTNFSSYPKEGFHDLFNNFHGEIGNLAIKYPHLEFRIKVKWDNIWVDQIKNAIFNYTKINSNNIKNLKIISNANTHQLIYESGLIMSFNSSTVVEAVALKKPVVVPLFDEADEFKGSLFKKHVYFKDYFNQFFIAKSKKDLELYLIKYLNNELPSIKINNDFIKYYIGEIDGNSTQRLINFISKLKTN